MRTAALSIFRAFWAGRTTSKGIRRKRRAGCFFPLARRGDALTGGTMINLMIPRVGPLRPAGFAWPRAGAAMCAVWFVAGAPPAWAQDAGGSHAVVQALPDQGHATLSAALARLAHSPRDVDALVDAGNGALAMGDTGAAIGFFTRADKIAPNTPRIEAGLAAAKVLAEEPLTALPLFEAAAARGPLEPARTSDRGLAYDLVGDNAAAQGSYRIALSGGAAGETADEASRRLAISLAIAGDERDAEVALAPLLKRQDRAAWRTRAFVMAILGKEEEAVSIARATMPEQLAIGIAPYLRYMRRLTHAQQAAAANLGHFPQPAEIGVDDPAIAAYQARPGGVHLASAEGDRALIPAGRPLGAAADGGALKPKHAQEAAAQPVTPPVAVTQPVAVSVPAPVAVAVTPPAPKPVAPKPVVVEAVAVRVAPPEPMPSRENTTGAAPVSTPAPATVPAPAPKPDATANAAAQAAVAPVTPPVAAPAPMPTPAPIPTPASTEQPAAAKPSFAQAFAAFGGAKAQAVPAAGAVDIRKIKVPRPAPKAPPPPPPPAHPSRIWVQIGVGRSASRLAFDWRHMVRDGGKLFKGKSPSTAAWGRTNRLLVGPFESDEAAGVWAAKAKGDHPDAFVWTSSAGQVVDPLEGQ